MFSSRSRRWTERNPELRPPAGTLGNQHNPAPSRLHLLLCCSSCSSSSSSSQPPSKTAACYSFAFIRMLGAMLALRPHAAVRVENSNLVRNRANRSGWTALIFGWLGSMQKIRMPLLVPLENGRKLDRRSTFTSGPRQREGAGGSSSGSSGRGSDSNCRPRFTQRLSAVRPSWRF